MQRPLWASTGTKNPRYPDTMYVDELVAPHTVNTMPLQTLLAVADHGEVRGATAEQDPSADLAALAEAGIDMDQVTEELLDEGIKQFEDAMRRLLAGIDERREAVVLGRPPTIRAAIPRELERPVAERVERAVAENVAERVWRRDASLWGGPGVPEIGDRLGWLTISETMLEHAPELHAFARECRADGFTDAVLLGMGGSSLGPEVIRRSFGQIPDGLRLHVLDSTHPDAVLDRGGIRSTSSGRCSSSPPSRAARSRRSRTTSTSESAQDRSSSSRSPTPAARWRSSPTTTASGAASQNPPDIGGRYSVLSYFGLVPAALMGVDVEALLHRCQVAEQNCAHYDSSESNSGLWLGAVAGELARRGRDKLTFVVSPPIESFGLWVEQLVAESTGKQGRGILPVADEPLAAPEAYGHDRVFVYLRNSDEPLEELDEEIGRLPPPANRP